MRQVRFRHLWIGPLIGIILGSFIEADEFAIKFLAIAIITVVAIFLHLMVQYTYAALTGFFNDGKTFLEQEERFMDLILALAAEMARADGKISQSERDSIKKRLELDLSAEKAEDYYRKFEQFLNTEVDLNRVCKKIDREFDDASKHQLMYILIGIATADGILSKKEVDLIQKIGSLSDISFGTISQILKIFQFKFEGQERQRSKQSKSTRTNRNTQYAKAYQIMGVPENSDFETIKDAYRKLAKIHHPDKVAHMGPRFQKRAKEIFQTIGDAYELLKQKMGN